MYKNLKEYISALEKRGELVRISAPVDPYLEMAEIIDRESKSPEGGRALLFENTGTDFPVLAGMMGSQRRVALALGVENIDDISLSISSLMDSIKTPKRRFIDKLKMLPLLAGASRWFPRHSNKRGDCQKVVWQGDKIDLSKLPILGTWPLDGGRFVTLPMVHTVDPTTGARNVGMYRMQVMGRNYTGMHWQMHKTGARHYQEYRRRGELMPVAVCLGGDPAYTYAATAPLPDGIDEYILAGFLRNKPVKMVQCLTQPLQVPPDVDFVIEGYVDPMEAKVIEGPFGDHTGFYSLSDMYPVFHITCITHRQDAVYPATLVGVPPMEDRYMALASERIFLAPIRMAIAPEVSDMWMPWQGVAHNLAVVEIPDRTYPGQGFKVASALWGAGQMSFCKYIIITDSIDKFRTQWRERPWTLRGSILFSSGVADTLDHAGDKMGRSGKMCIDTTEGEQEYRLQVVFDDGVESLNDDERLWIALGNTDPGRDVSLSEDGLIRVDARSKQLKERDFPNIVTMDSRTIKLVNERWSEYGLGEFKPSPSLRYKHLIKGNDAKQT